MADGNDPTHKTLDLVDCAVFAGMLGISAIIGVYHAYKSRKSTDAVREYLVGGQNMSIFPISMSLIASYISGISILGLPAEMYVYGTQFWCVVIADSFVSLTMAFVYLPVFYGLGITSSYEYLKLRFNDGVRLMGSAIFLIKMLLYIPLVIYVPALAFNQVTGINLHAIALLVSMVCIFYTTLGGLKAVVWTDAVQTVVMFGGVVLVAVYGTIRAGGIDFVWEKNRETNRIEFFNFDMDPTTRHTFWSVVIGNYLNWLATCSVNQAMVQRCLAMPNLKMANTTIVIMAIGIITIVSLNCYTGLVLFAAFHDCDPVKTKQIGKSDQLLPFFVMELAASIPGLPGLFVACVFSAALSTMSTGLNSMAGVIFEDMIRPYLRGPVSDVAASRTMKATVVVIGTICVALVFLVEKLGGLIQAGKSLSGITAGPLLGMFTLGMFFPSANSAVSQSIAQFPHRRSLHLSANGQTENNDSLSLLYPFISRSLSLCICVSGCFATGSNGRWSFGFESGRLDLIRYSGSHFHRRDRVSREAGVDRRMPGIAKESRRQFHVDHRSHDPGTPVSPLQNVVPLVHLGRISDRDSGRLARLVDHRIEPTQIWRREIVHADDTPFSAVHSHRGRRKSTGCHGTREARNGCDWQPSNAESSVVGRTLRVWFANRIDRERNDPRSCEFSFLYALINSQPIRVYVL